MSARTVLITLVVSMYVQLYIIILLITDVTPVSSSCCVYIAWLHVICHIICPHTPACMSHHFSTCHSPPIKAGCTFLCVWYSIIHIVGVIAGKNYCGACNKSQRATITWLLLLIIAPNVRSWVNPILWQVELSFLPRKYLSTSFNRAELIQYAGPVA